jgi:hypothetical protein
MSASTDCGHTAALSSYVQILLNVVVTAEIRDVQRHQVGSTEERGGADLRRKHRRQHRTSAGRASSGSRKARAR